MVLDYGTLGCVCGGLAVSFALFVIVDFVSFAGTRYRERYLKQAAVELDDVLLQMPADRIFDISLAVSGLAVFLALALLGLNSSEWSWNKAVFIGILAAVLSFPIPRFYLRFLKKRRLIRFNEQLEDALSTMSSSLKAGFSINQAIDAIANENRRPISIEFRILMQEVRLGVSLDEALYKMMDRLESDDFELVAMAIITARQTGGELTAVFERLAGMIRERGRINGRLRALTAQGKLQATIISLMPLVLLFLMFKIAPQMMSHFFNSIIGICLISGVVFLEVVGFFVIKKITTIDV